MMRGFYADPSAQSTNRGFAGVTKICLSLGTQRPPKQGRRGVYSGFSLARAGFSLLRAAFVMRAETPGAARTPAAAHRSVSKARRHAGRRRLFDLRAASAAEARAACLPAFRPPSQVLKVPCPRALAALRPDGRGARRRFAWRALLRRAPPCGRLRRGLSRPFVSHAPERLVLGVRASHAHGPAGA